MAMAAKKNVRSTTRQIEMLVDYMSTHTLFAVGEYRGPLGREGQDEEWVRLQQILQEHGPNKTVEQWRTTWRDLKKKARADGARVNSACAETGNHTTIPSLSLISSKILDIIGTESAYGVAGQQETGLGEIVPPPPAVPQPPPPAVPQPTPLAVSQPPTPTVPQPPPPALPQLPPPATPVRSLPPDTTPSTSSVPPIAPPSNPSTTTHRASARGQRARSLRNDFLVSDAETRSVLQDIQNRIREFNAVKEREMRRSHLQRLQSSRMAKHNSMGPKNLQSVN